MTKSISPHTVLIYLMVTMAAVDRSMSDNELRKIGDIVQSLPVFDGFDPERLVTIAEDCGAILSEEDGLDVVFALAKENLPAPLYETAYALAVEVAAADVTVQQEEIRLLQLLRDTLGIEALAAAAIERGARARHARI